MAYVQKPKVGDSFYNSNLDALGRICKIGDSLWTGKPEITVEYVGTIFEDETYEIVNIRYEKIHQVWVS